MTAEDPASGRLVARQLDRTPRTPWRIAATCASGHPTVIVSPSVLADGTPFPTWAWLTCPYLAERASEAESAGATARWTARAAADPVLAEELRVTDARLRAARAAESGGADACSAVGIAGQRDPLLVKCLHAHVALALCGLGDPIGEELLGEGPRECADDRCAAFAEEDGEDRS